MRVVSRTSDLLVLRPGREGHRARARKDYELVYVDSPAFKDVATRVQQLGP